MVYTVYIKCIIGMYAIDIMCEDSELFTDLATHWTLEMLHADKEGHCLIKYYLLRGKQNFKYRNSLSKE